MSAGYQGTAAEAQRQLKLEKEREEMMKKFEDDKEKIRKINEVKVTQEKFVTQIDDVESGLKRDTVGLVHFDDFRRIRQAHEHERMQRVLESEAKKNEEAKKDDTKKRKAPAKAKLSFNMDDDEEGGGEEEVVVKKKSKVGKNPDVDTSFLPDKEREEEERQERERLRREWLALQEKIKQESIQITYSYWDGSGHRKAVQCKKGDTIAQFLEKCRQQFPELKATSVDNMLYIKEDLIIPQHYTFYDFIINKARGKSGPLFNFDVKDDVRLINDASVETEESHAGKVVERRWYERNKHIFPASRWEVYDPEKDYGSYTIKDTKKDKA